MRVILARKRLKLNLNFVNEKEKFRKIFPLYCNWKCCYKSSLLRTECFLSAINGLRNSPKILHITEGDFFNQNSLQRDESMLLTCCRSALNSVLARLPCYLWKGPVKRDFCRHSSNQLFRSL